MAGDEVLIQPDMLLGGRAVRYGAPQLATEAQAFPRNVEAPLLGVLVDHEHPEEAYLPPHSGQVFFCLGKERRDNSNSYTMNVHKS